MQEFNDGWANLQMIVQRRFHPGVQQSKRLSTGFPPLDQALGGGLSPGLIILGGMPALGKSTLALQIAAHVAEAGSPVLYFSLEMPASRILAKMISRKIYEDAARTQKPSSLPVTADQLLNGELDQAQWEEVERVKQALPLEQLHIYTKPLSASGILEWVKPFTDRGERPLVIIDYLQILPPEKGAQSDKQAVDSILRCLMQLAHSLHAGPSADPDGDTGEGLPVILISSLNRNSYKTPIQISSFKETGDIEYSADLLLGLQFRACHSKTIDLSKTADLTAELDKFPREVELTILKNRYGRSGNAVPLQYDPAHDYFFPLTAEMKRGAAVQETKTASEPVGAVPGIRTGSDGAHSAQLSPEENRTVPAAGKPRSKPFYSVINNTLVFARIRKGVFGEQSCNALEGSDVLTSYALSEPLSCLDCCVADAIYSLAQKGAEISLNAVFKTLLGYKRATLTKQKRQELESSIQHLRTVQFSLDCTQEWAVRDLEGWAYQGPFLAVEDAGPNGVYRPAPEADPHGILPLYQYGAAIGQIITFPSILLEVYELDGRLLSNTQDNICLKRFLIHRLEVIRHESSPEAIRNNKEKKKKQVHNNLRTISFRPDGNLLTELRLTGPSTDVARQQRLRRLYESTQRILAYYKRLGYIEKFEHPKQSMLPGQKAQLPSFRIIGGIHNPETLTSAEQPL